METFILDRERIHCLSSEQKNTVSYSSWRIFVCGQRSQAIVKKLLHKVIPPDMKILSLSVTAAFLGHKHKMVPYEFNLELSWQRMWSDNICI